MLNKDFYPTPPEVAAAMLDPFDIKGCIVLEPSAGSGNLVQECLSRGAAEVLTLEVEPKLRSILSAIPNSRLIGTDFLQLQPEAISHVDYIVMNPPFSADEDHILHAWEIAPPGCKIISLCNWSTLNNYSYGKKREQLKQLIEGYGSSQNVGAAFEDAERATRVQIGLIFLEKPGYSTDGQYEGFFLGPDEVEAQGQGLIPYRVTRDIVNRYVEACRIYDEQLAAAVRLQNVLQGFYGGDLGMQVTQDGEPVSRNRFRKDLQKEAWQYVFKRILPEKMATSGLRSDINKFVEQQSHIPFTERNILRMVQIVMGTQEQRVDRAVEEIFDKLTKHTKENRWQVEGWVTNDSYLFNKKFIFPNLAELEWSGGGVRIPSYGGEATKIDDLIKALCSITGKSYEDVRFPVGGMDRLHAGSWYEHGFFRFKAHKKGTVHFEFLDEDDWAMLNKRVAKIKGMTLPENLGNKRKKGGGRV